MTAAGAEVGDIEGVVENNAEKKQFLVVKRGEFLGFGGKEVALPLDTVAVQNGKVVLRGMDVAQVEAMPEFNNKTASRSASRSCSDHHEHDGGLAPPAPDPGRRGQAVGRPILQVRFKAVGYVVGVLVLLIALLAAATIGVLVLFG